MLEIIMALLWVALAVYITWYFTSAKNYAPITFKEARILWKIHKQGVQCNGRRWREIKRSDKIVGFECECGYKHVQKRPIVASMPSPEVQSQTLWFDKLPTSQKST